MKDEVGNKVRNIQGWWPLLLLLLLWCWLLTHFLYSTYTNRYLGKWSFPDGFSPIFQNPIICEKISSHFFESLCKNSHHFFYCVIFGLTNFFNKIYYQELFFDSCHFFRWGKIWSIRSRDRITWGSSNILTTWYVFPSFFCFWVSI